MNRRTHSALGRGRRRSMACIVAVTAVFCSFTLTGCTPNQLQVTASPSLFPLFDPAVSDYAVRCDPATPVHLDVNPPANTSVSVAGRPPQSGAFSADVQRNVGQSFTIVSTTAGVASTYYVRCLPSDFPTWTTTRGGPTQAQWYVVQPLSATPYLAIFDNNGVPVWWRKSDAPVTFFTYFSNGDVAWTRQSGAPAEERRLDGSLVRLIDSAPAGNDFHELQLLANGHYLIAANRQRTVDLTSIGGPANASITDPVIEEVTASGSVAWSWDTYDHIPVTETRPEWAGNQSPYDLYHFNSIGADGAGRVVISYRHLNAVYDVDKATGHIVFKLGGSPRLESLSVKNDPAFSAGTGFSGQHDPRILPDGTLTVHDNGTMAGRAPRAVRYQLDLTASPRTATLVEAITDPAAPDSTCCGSARKLAGGNWVMSWGRNPVVTELTPAGQRVFGLNFGPTVFSYRAVPVPPGQLSYAQLRAGMDAQHPG